MADFAVEPLADVVAELRREVPANLLERVVLLAERPGAVPYALPIELPPPGHPLRERGLALLWARAVTVAAGIVGTSRLRIVTQHDETCAWLQAAFQAQPKVVDHLAQYGEFSLTRANHGDVPAELRAMPFLRACKGTVDYTPRGTHMMEHAKQAGTRVFVGVDYGRSDVKCAAVDEAGQELAVYVTRWWRTEAGSEDRRYLDPATLTSIDEPLRCLGEGALEVLRLASEKLLDGVAAKAPRFDDDTIAGQVRPVPLQICGLGLSAAGCVRDGRLCGLPPAFGGCDATASAPVLERLEAAVLDYVAEHLETRFGGHITVAVKECATMLVNDGDASAMWGAAGLGAVSSGREPIVGLFLSCGTGLAGGIVRQGGDVLSGGVLETGKLVMGLPVGAGLAPIHDTLGIPGAAQGMAGTQRSFFNLLAARGGPLVEGKAEQRAAIVAMQKRPLDDEVRDIFTSLGSWLACFVVELSEYLPVSISLVEAGGKLTDAASGDVMLGQTRKILQQRGIANVRRANESEFGQALALALAVKEAKIAA